MMSVIESTSSLDEDPTIIFKVAMGCHGLIHSDFVQTLPEIVCQPGYQARWIANIGLKIITEARLKFDGKKIQGFDTLWLEMFYNTMIEEAKVPEFERNLGNIPALQEWQSFLPKYDCTVLLPWFYNRDFTNYFPIYQCGTLNELTHEVKFKNDLNKLLLVQRIEDGKLVPLAEGISRINRMTYVEDCPRMPTSGCIPEMWGEYLFLSDLECNANRHIANPTIYYHDYITVDAREEVNLRGGKVGVDLTYTDPVHMIGWVMRNVSSEGRRDASNYTSHPSDRLAGWSPIANSTLQITRDVNSKLFERMPSWRTNRAYPHRQLLCTPRNRGMHFWFLGSTAKSSNHHPGVVFNDGHLAVELEDTNPFIGATLADGTVIPANEDDKFQLQVRLVTTRKFTFRVVPESEAQRQAFKSVIEIADVSVAPVAPANSRAGPVASPIPAGPVASPAPAGPVGPQLRSAAAIPVPPPVPVR
jgi:hypothetical protein